MPITPESIPDVMKDQCALDAGATAGKTLGDTLHNGYDRMKDTEEMQAEWRKRHEAEAGAPRLGSNANAFLGGFRMWEPAASRTPHTPQGLRDDQAKEAKGSRT